MPHALAGAVVRGDGIGSKQTVPTLNLDTKAEVVPEDGVYITRTGCWNAAGMAIDHEYRPSPHIQWPASDHRDYLLSPLDGAPPEAIAVEFLRRVRDERKFESPEALKAQILRDVAARKRIFAAGEVAASR